MKSVVVISGLSGAGKSVALKQYEDLGYYCIDNLPMQMIPSLLRRLRQVDREDTQRLALGIDSRERSAGIKRFPAQVDRIREQGVEVRVLFLTASDEVLLRRYSETRRRHPLSSNGLPLLDAIHRERELLAPIANSADDTLDTSHLNLHELRDLLHARLPEQRISRLSLLFLSFGFKHGVPGGIDFLFDVRCLPNPHWTPTLRRKTGQDPEVRQWLEERPPVLDMANHISSFLQHWLPVFAAQDRIYVTVAVGCTGGQHRSVFLVERLATHFSTQFEQVSLRHRELDQSRQLPLRS